MTDQLDGSPQMRLGVANALCRLYVSKGHSLLAFLAELLDEAMPDEAKVIYTTQRLKRKRVCAVEITFRNDHFTLEDNGNGTLMATSTHFAQGSPLPLQVMEVPMWLTIASDAIEFRASEDAEAREILRKALGL